MKTRVYPNNPACPLSDKEKTQLGIVLDSLEWEAYAPLKKLTSSYAEAKVTEYDEFEIKVEVKSGSDATGNHYTDPVTIERANLYALSV
jgi:hypothetical protein